MFFIDYPDSSVQNSDSSQIVITMKIRIFPAIILTQFFTIISMIYRPTFEQTFDYLTIKIVLQ